MGRYSSCGEYRPIPLTVVACVVSCTPVHSKSPIAPQLFLHTRGQ